MEELSSEVKYIAKNLYEDAELKLDRQGNLESISLIDYDDYNDYHYECTEQEYNQAKALVEKLTDGAKYYQGYLELNDNHTLWDIDFPADIKSFTDEDYGVLYDDAMRGLEEEIGTEVYGLGRSGRHICIDNTFANLCHYNEYKEIQRKWEKILIQNVEDEVKNGKPVTEALNYGESIVECPECGSYIHYTKRDVIKDIDGDFVTCPKCEFLVIADSDELDDVVTEGKKDIREPVVEYTITMSEGNDYISEDKDEADAKFEELKQSDKFNDVEQYYAKTWVWDDEYDDWVEDYVEVYYTKGNTVDEDDISNFDSEDFESRIPHKMRWKEYDIIDGKYLYWVTQEFFNENDVKQFAEQFKTTGFEMAYLTVRDLSFAYNFDDDLSNDIFVIVLADGTYNMTGYLNACRKDEYDPSLYEVSSSDKEPKDESKVTTPKGTFDYEEHREYERKMREAFKSLWKGDFSKEAVDEFEAIKSEMSKYLTSAEIRNAQYDASREVDRDEAKKTESEDLSQVKKYDTMAFAQSLPMSYTDMVDNDIYDVANEIYDDGGSTDDVVDYYINKFIEYLEDDEDVIEDFDKELARKYIEYKLDMLSKNEDKTLTEAEDLNQVKADIEDAIKDTPSTEQEIDQVKGSLDVLKTDEESAIEGYKDFQKETDKVVDKELADAVNDQMQEIVDDEKEHIEKLDAVKTALGEGKVNVGMLQKGQKAVEKKLKSIDKNLTMDDIDIKTDDDGSMHISNREDNNELCVITQDELAKLLKENNEVKTEDITDSLDLEQLANDIVDWYSKDMETWFDEIQGNEEDVYNDTLTTLEIKDIATIKKIIEDMEEYVLGLNAMGKKDEEGTEVMIDKLKELLPKDTLQEDLAPTIKESLNTDVLPIIDVDLYSILSSGMFDDYDIPDDISSLDEIVQDVAPKYIKETVQKVLPSAEVYVTGVYHPREYNFSGDELEFDLVVSGDEYKELKEKVLADSSFEQFLKDKYSSRSGFTSSLPNSLDKFNQAPEWKQLVQVIMFALKDVDLEKVYDEYLEEFLERVREEFPYADELDESKKVEGRLLKFQQITDDRFDSDIQTLLQKRLDELTDKLNIDGIEFNYSEPYEIDFGDNKQWRADCTVKKTSTDITWNDIYKIINSVKAVPYKLVTEGKKIEDKELLNEDAVKEWWVGDPCYVLDDDLYDNVWGKEYNFDDGTIDCGNGLSFQVHGTAFGDGGYEGSNGFIYGVDAGVLAIVPMELVAKEDGIRLGTVHKSASAELEYEDGVFHMIFDNETIDIDTDPSDEGDDYLGLSESKILKNKGVNK